MRGPTGAERRWVFLGQAGKRTAEARDRGRSTAGSRFPAVELLPRCGWRDCRTGRMHVWRSRRVPVFEQRWACSPECLRALVTAAVAREGQDLGGPERADRFPVGLLLLEQGAISGEQLRQALRERDRQGETESGLGEWLLRSGLLSETALARARSAQWNCPVLSPSGSRAPEMGSAVPRFLAEALGAVPLRTLGGGVLTLAFSTRVDRSLTYAIEHVTGMRVAAGVARASEFQREQERFFSAPAPEARLLEAESLGALARAIAGCIEQEKAPEARVARVHDFWWLRIWRQNPGDRGLPGSPAVADQIWRVGGRRTP